MKSDNTKQTQSKNSLNDAKNGNQTNQEKTAEFLDELKFLERRACWRGSYGESAIKK